MKHNLFIAFLIFNFQFSICTLFSQETKPRLLTISYEAGYSNQFRNPADQSGLYLNGIRMGVLTKFNLSNRLYLQTGGLYVFSQYAKTQGFSSSGKIHRSGSASQLDIPVYAGYYVPMFAGVRFFAYGGADFRIGLAEKRLVAHSNLTDSTMALIRKNDLYIAAGVANPYANKEINRLSVLLGVGGGFEWNRFFIKSGYDFDLTGIQLKNQKRITQNGWFVSFGYNF